MTRAIGLLLIPAIGLSIAIVPAAFVRDPAGLGMHVIPDSGAGWLSGTAWIYDDAGRVSLGAHSTGDFYLLGDLRAGDIITIVGDDGAVSYRVTDTRAVSRWDTSWMKRGDGPATLTLITCTSDAGWRFIVNATRIDGAG